MNPSEIRSNLIDDAAIDRLIDGELDDLERRELLLALENDPEGWRRCALAFLEDQTLRAALTGRSSAIAKTDLAMVAPTVIRRSRHWLRRVSIAASILGATFALGFAAGGNSKASPQVEVAKSDPPKPVEPVTKAEGGQVRAVGWVDIVDASNGELPSERVPILSGPGINEKLLRQQPPSIPDYVRARWERQGYQVEEERKLVSVTLKDGRRVSIPIDEVALNYVGQNPL